jgi:CBS-domain-containing membrane protein
MNVAFFLTPLADVVWIPARATMRQAMHRLAHHRFAALPVLDEEGRYVDTLTEGDLLRKLVDGRLSLDDTDRVPLSEVPRRVDNRAVDVTTDIERLVAAAIDRNFVPVVDSRGVLMGIVRRRKIIEYCARLIEGRPPSAG